MHCATAMLNAIITFPPVDDSTAQGTYQAISNNHEALRREILGSRLQRHHTRPAFVSLHRSTLTGSSLFAIRRNSRCKMRWCRTSHSQTLPHFMITDARLMFFGKNYYNLELSDKAFPS